MKTLSVRLSDSEHELVSEWIGDDQSKAREVLVAESIGYRGDLMQSLKLQVAEAARLLSIATTPLRPQDESMTAIFEADRVISNALEMLK